MPDRPCGYGKWDLWQAPILPVVDFNGDGKVDLQDLLILIEHWGTSDPPSEPKHDRHRLSQGTRHRISVRLAHTRQAIAKLRWAMPPTVLIQNAGPLRACAASFGVPPSGGPRVSRASCPRGEGWDAAYAEVASEVSNPKGSFEAKRASMYYYFRD
jgi:hypothetical protein